MIDFSGQSVILAGAGRGLGRLYALELARRGAQVVVNDIGSTTDGHGSDRTVADSVVAEMTAAGGIAVVSHESVASPEGGESIVQTALDTWGRLDAVISDAGIFQTVPFADLPVADWRRMLSSTSTPPSTSASRRSGPCATRRAAAASCSSPRRPGSSDRPRSPTTPPPRPDCWD